MRAAFLCSSIPSRCCVFHQTFASTAAVVSTSSHNEPNASANELEQSAEETDVLGEFGQQRAYMERALVALKT